MLTILVRVYLLVYTCSNVASATICDDCACKYDRNVNEDYVGDRIDCSYKTQDILNTGNALPSIVASLDLSSSNLSRIQESNLLKSQTLTELYLNNNHISVIEDNALQLPSLKRLDLSYNELEAIDKEAFKSLINLEYLNLANNRFTSFSKIAFHHLRNLNEIVLDYNNLGPSLSEVNLFNSKGGGLSQKIQNFSVRSINLNVVPDNFFVDMYDIRKLIVSGNNITEVFELPPTLEYLDLSDNPIEEISEEDFTDVPGLRELRLNNLRIKEVPPFAFASLRGLIKLELERNKNLTEFSPLTFGTEVLEDADDFILERLSLRGSRVSQLDKSLLEPFGQLFQLDLQGNPWICDCNILWVKKLQIAPEDYDHLR